jgi:hypothetical protein
VSGDKDGNVLAGRLGCLDRGSSSSSLESSTELCGAVARLKLLSEPLGGGAVVSWGHPPAIHVIKNRPCQKIDIAALHPLLMSENFAILIVRGRLRAMLRMGHCG